MTVLRGSRCLRCARVCVPQRDACPVCAGPTEPRTLPSEGELLTYTVVEKPPAGFEPGYALGVIALTGCLVMARADRPLPVEVGARVRVSARGERLLFEPVT